MLSSIILEITPDFPMHMRTDMSELLSSLPYRPVWQTIEWQLMLRESNYTAKSYFIGIYEEGKLLSYVLLEKRSLGLGLYGLFAIGGPMVSDISYENTLSDAIESIVNKESVVFVQLEPTLDIPVFADFAVGNYKNFLEKHTATIDLKQDEESILSHMKPKGRYNIRVAEKAGVIVEQVDFSEESLSVFYDLLTETLERDQFAANSKSYFRIMLQYLEKNNLGGLFFAERENEVIAAGIFVFSGKTALYYYGASSSDNSKRKYMASYLLQWEAIREGKKRGCEVYDFLGIADPGNEKSHLAGVTDFKMKFTDEVWRLPESQILVVRKVAHFILSLRKMVKKMLH